MNFKEHDNNWFFRIYLLIISKAFLLFEFASLFISRNRIKSITCTWNHSISMTQNKVIATCSIEHELRSYLVSLPVKEKKHQSENNFHKPHCYFTRLNLKKMGPLQFCLPALLEIHRNHKQKEFLKSCEGLLR